MKEEYFDMRNICQECKIVNMVMEKKEIEIQEVEGKIIFIEIPMLRFLNFTTYIVKATMLRKIVSMYKNKPNATIA